MSDIVVIAEEELVLAFKLIGVEGIPVCGREEALAAFRSSTLPPRQGGGARKRLLIMPTNVATSLDKELQEWCRRGEYPLVVEIPALDPTYRAQRSVDDAIRHAIGTAI